MPLYPLKFKPLMMEKIWGGRKIETVFGKALPPGKPIGESWELCDLPPGAVEGTTDWISSEVADGPLAGRTLRWLIQNHRQELLADVPLFKPHGQFPLLVKFLDAREDLSVQVHPDLGYVARHPEAYLKNEAWYVVQTDEGGRLLKDLKPGVTKEQFRAAIADGTVEDLIKTVYVKAGDCVYLPSGTVHALGKGVFAAEVQTPSDSTFRVYDYKRIDASTGKERKLHIEPALEVIDFSGKEPAPQRRQHVAGLHTTVTRLVTCPNFTIEKVRFREGVEEPVPYDWPVVWVVLEGQAEVKVDDVAEPTKMGRGDTVLLPAAMKNPILKTLSDCVWLEVTFP